MMNLTERALQLVIDFEVGGRDAYEQKYRHPIWPQAASGITVGIGYDVGYVTRAKFQTDFAALDSVSRDALGTVCGLTGAAAKAALHSVSGVVVDWDTAIDVFQHVSVPEFFGKLERAMPGVSRLHPEIQGALWSLVYNRGTSMENNDRRREMREIRDAVAANKPERIPALIRSMIRIWVGTSIEKGMRRRREAEAQLVEIGLAANTLPEGDAEIPRPAPFTRTLRIGSRGDDVVQLQRTLKSLGLYSGQLDGDFGPMTLSAVKRLQLQAALDIDGVVGPHTWIALSGDSELPVTEITSALADKRERIAVIAAEEGAKGLAWTNSSSEAEKYLKPLRKPMQDLGHIGQAPVFYNWCAAFVTFCAREAGYVVPDVPPGLGVTVALAEAWRKWGQNTGTFVRRQDTTPRRGDIVVFEWSDGDSQIDHIGIVTRYDSGSTVIHTSEGNRGNKTVNGTRNLATAVGFIRLT